jgi:hypothetical protein
MKRLLLVGAVIAAFGASPAFGAGIARWYAPNLAVALHKEEVRTDNAGPFTATHCFTTDGNARIGWRNISCVGNVNLAGSTYRYKAIYTPAGCSHQTINLTVFSANDDGTDNHSVLHKVWRHDIFTCKVS